MWCGDECILSHGTNLSAGVAIIFSPNTKVRIMIKQEIEPERLLAVRVEINGIFVNIYAPNSGFGRINTFNKLKLFLKQKQPEDLIFLGGDWNCTLDPPLDRNGEEPNFNSPAVLANIIVSFDFTDIWRENNVLVKQFTWVKVNEGRISAARLDRLYVLNDMKNIMLYIQLLSPHIFLITSLLLLTLH